MAPASRRSQCLWSTKRKSPADFLRQHSLCLPLKALCVSLQPWYCPSYFPSAGPFQALTQSVEKNNPEITLCSRETGPKLRKQVNTMPAHPRLWEIRAALLCSGTQAHWKAEWSLQELWFEIHIRSTYTVWQAWSGESAYHRTFKAWWSADEKLLSGLSVYMIIFLQEPETPGYSSQSQPRTFNSLKEWHEVLRDFLRLSWAGPSGVFRGPKWGYPHGFKVMWEGDLCNSDGLEIWPHTQALLAISL